MGKTGYCFELTIYVISTFDNLQVVLIMAVRRESQTTADAPGSPLAFPRPFRHASLPESDVIIIKAYAAWPNRTKGCEKSYYSI
jgi:hypothetical protein